MTLSNEKLCLLYQEATDEKNKQIILNELWNKNILFINNIINKVLNAYYFLDREDLYNETYIVFKTCIDKYDINKAKLSTYLYYRLYLRLLDIFKKDYYWNECRASKYELVEDSDSQVNNKLIFEDDTFKSSDNKSILNKLFELSIDKKIKKKYRLSEIQKDVILNKLGLENRDKKTFDELAIFYNLKSKAVKNLYYNGIKKLKMLKEKYL